MIYGMPVDVWLPDESDVEFSRYEAIEEEIRQELVEAGFYDVIVAVAD